MIEECVGELQSSFTVSFWRRAVNSQRTILTCHRKASIVVGTEVSISVARYDNMLQGQLGSHLTSAPNFCTISSCMLLNYGSEFESEFESESEC